MGREFGASWSVAEGVEQRATPGATPRWADSVQVVLLVCLNHHVRSGFGRACKSKRPGAEASRPSRTPGQPSLKADRALREPAVRGPRRRCCRGGAVAEAALSQRHPCRRAGVAPAGVQVSTKPAAFWSASRKPQPLTSIVPDTICDEGGGVVSRGAAGGGGQRVAGGG